MQMHADVTNVCQPSLPVKHPSQAETHSTDNCRPCSMTNSFTAPLTAPLLTVPSMHLDLEAKDTTTVTPELGCVDTRKDNEIWLGCNHRRKVLAVASQTGSTNSVLWPQAITTKERAPSHPVRFCQPLPASFHPASMHSPVSFRPSIPA